MAEENFPSASISYLVTGLPEFKSELRFKEYFSRKRNCGGAGEVANCEAVSDTSILLTYEKTSDAPKVMEYTHEFDGKEAKLHPLLKEKVTVTYQGPIAALVDVEKEKQLAARDDIGFHYHESKLCLEGNWYNIERFRNSLKSRMVDSLKRDETKVVSAMSAANNTSTASLKLPPGTVHLTSLSSDVLALMQKCGVCRSDHITHDMENGCVVIECLGDDKMASAIAEKFQREYSQLMMGGKLKEHSFPTSDSQQIDELITQMNTDYSQSVFRHDEENQVIKCVSMSARQLSHIKIKLKELLTQPIQGAANPHTTAKADTNPSLSISLPGGRTVILKQANIVLETVDVIVNAANERLVHGAGVAAAINRASQGTVQQSSTVLFNTNGPVPTGEVVYTEAGGNLRCKYVIHAVGPEGYKHKNQSNQLLWTACLNALQQAETLRAESIAFPPISSGLFGLSKEMVAEVLINAACSYQCQSTGLLNDIRLVIIDKETFEAFVPVFIAKKGEVEADITTVASQPAVTAPHYTRFIVPQRANSWNESPASDNCPICLNPIVDKVTTSCQHSYCQACLQKALQKKPFCPMCNQKLQPVRGNQPAGQMRYRTIGTHLPGYPKHGTIVITYDIPSGTQTEEHPNPGQKYTGCVRATYLPDSPEGREVLALLKKAFDARLIFTIGTSHSSGRSNTVIWRSDISHKSSMDDGPDKFGYPDDGYLKRVRAQLQLQGIL